MAMINMRPKALKILIKQFPTICTDNKRLLIVNVIVVSILTYFLPKLCRHSYAR